MLFCKKCKALMIPKKKAGKNVMTCSSCGFSDSKDPGMIKEKIEDTGNRVEVVHKEIETLPLVEVKCPKCEHPNSYFWEIQTRASDEPPTKFHKCQECKHIWRDYK